VPANVTSVIKKHRVRNAPAPPAGSAPRPAPRPGAVPPNGANAQVRVAHRHDDHAVLEVRCPCGNVMYVECRWPIPEAAEGHPPGAPDNGRPANKEAT